MLLTLVIPVPTSNARFATGGAGRFINSINWIEWGRSGELIPASGKTVVENRQVGEYTISNTCTISQPPTGTGFGDTRTTMKVYIPGSYHQDGFDDIYNIGGSDRENRMTAGISNITRGALVRFKIDCHTTVKGPGLPSDGVVAPLDGLVFADAESSNRSSTIGSVAAEAPAATDWYIIDRHRNGTCTQQTLAVLEPKGATEVLRLEPSGSACPSGPTAVAFMKVPPARNGATSAVISVQGEGLSAVAVGVVQSFDFGDAPDSYGSAVARYQPDWTGNSLSSGTTRTFDSSLADMGNPSIMLGRSITPDQGSHTSPDTGDDGFSQTEPRPATPGLAAKETATCTGTGYVRGWIDWNSNGRFDPGEASDTVACTAGKAELTWTVPENAVSSYPNNNQPGGKDHTYVRLRAAATADELSSATGFTPSGEVEDHPYSLMLAELKVEKSSDALRGKKFAGDVVSYTVSAKNIAPDGFIDSYPAHLFDDLTGLLDDAQFIPGSLRTTIDGSATTNQASFDSRSKLISWHGPLKSQSTVQITYQVRLGTSGDRKVGNVAWGQHGGPDTPITGVDCSPRSESGWDSSPEVPCARDDFRLLSMIKLVQINYDDWPATSGIWNLTATGDFGGEPGDTERTVPGGTVANNRNTFVIPATGSFTFTEAPRNARGIGYTLLSTTWDEDAGVVTFVNADTPAALTWSKTDSETGTLLAGSAWQLSGRELQNLTITDCVAADAASCTDRDRDPVAGSFRIEGLAWGTYTLVEVTAPTGYQLDATPRQIQVRGDTTTQLAELGTIPNTRMLGEVTWNKTDGATGKPLHGAEFRLTGPGGASRDVPDCVAADATACTGADKDPRGGGFRVTGLVWGQWRLVESRAPLGYVLSTREVDFGISHDALTHQVADPFRNTPTVLPTLPLTGGTAADLYLIGGGAFMALAVALITFRRIRTARQISHKMEGTP